MMMKRMMMVVMMLMILMIIMRMMIIMIAYNIDKHMKNIYLRNLHLLMICTDKFSLLSGESYCADSRGYITYDDHVLTDVYIFRCG